MEHFEWLTRKRPNKIDLPGLSPRLVPLPYLNSFDQSTNRWMANSDILQFLYGFRVRSWLVAISGGPIKGTPYLIPCPSNLATIELSIVSLCLPTGLPVRR